MFPTTAAAPAEAVAIRAKPLPNRPPPWTLPPPTTPHPGAAEHPAGVSAGDENNLSPSLMFPDDDPPIVIAIVAVVQRRWASSAGAAAVAIHDAVVVGDEDAWCHRSCVVNDLVDPLSNIVGTNADIALGIREGRGTGAEAF